MANLLGWIHRSLCSLRGHDELLEFEASRMFLRCSSCGHETPGWEVGGAVTRDWQRPPKPAPRLRPQFARQRQAA